MDSQLRFIEFATALEECDSQAVLFIERLLGSLGADSILYWVFKYYTIHYKAITPIEGIIDSHFDSKKLEWIQGLFGALLYLDDVEITKECDPLHDDNLCIYLFGLLCQGKSWTNEDIHETWKVVFEGNALLQLDANGNYVGNPCRAIHQRISKKMMAMTTKKSAKRLLSIIGTDFDSLMPTIEGYLEALWCYFYIEREANRNKILESSPKFFDSTPIAIDQPSLEDFLDNLKYSKNNNLRREANEPMNMILSAILTSSELYQIERLCTNQVLRQDEHLKLELTDFTDEVTIAMVHIVLLFQFEDMEDLFQHEWISDLFYHYITMLVEYDMVVITYIVLFYPCVL